MHLVAMCITCCSHKQLLADTNHSCSQDYSRGQLYHVGVFRLNPQGVVFPGEHLVLDVYLPSSLRLLREARNGLQSVDHIPDPTWGWPSDQASLLRRAIAIAPSEHAEVGALAVFDQQNVPTPAHSLKCARFRVRVVGRYIRQGSAHYHCGYPCLPVRLLCEIEPIALDMPLNKAFPYTAPHPKVQPKRPSGMMTRGTLAAITLRERRRSSAYMGGLSYLHWRALDPHVLVRRARAAAIHSRLDVDRLQVEDLPRDDACPSRWSFWLAASLPPEVGLANRFLLLKETSGAIRLQRLIKILQASRRQHKMPRSRRSSKDIPYRFGGRVKVQQLPSTCRTKEQTSPHSGDEISSKTVDGQGTQVLDCIVWPCSAAGGFTRVRTRYVTRGRFQPLRPV